MSKRPCSDYRVIRKTLKLSENLTEYQYDIHQVWYDLEKGEQSGPEEFIETYSLEPISPSGDTLEFLQGELNLMQKALTKPILEEVEVQPLVIELRPVADQRLKTGLPIFDKKCKSKNKKGVKTHRG